MQKKLVGWDRALVTFSLPAEVEASEVAVVGEFNDWAPDVHFMSRDDSGFFVEVPIATGHAYRFRYLLDGERWQNDWAADAYVSNEFGGEDSVVDLTALSSAEARARDGSVIGHMQSSGVEAGSCALPRHTVAL